MLTTTIESVRPLPDDQEVLGALRTECGSPAESLVGLRRVALLGPDGRAYRLILAQGDTEFEKIIRCLTRRRFRPVSPFAAMDAVLRR